MQKGGTEGGSKSGSKSGASSSLSSGLTSVVVGSVLGFVVRFVVRFVVGLGREVTLGTPGVTSMVEIRQLLCSFRRSIGAAAGTFVGAGKVGFVYSIRLSFARVTVQKQS